MGDVSSFNNLINYRSNIETKINQCNGYFIHLLTQNRKGIDELSIELEVDLLDFRCLSLMNNQNNASLLEFEIYFRIEAIIPAHTTAIISLKKIYKIVNRGFKKWLSENQIQPLFEFWISLDYQHIDKFWYFPKGCNHSGHLQHKPVHIRQKA